MMPDLGRLVGGAFWRPPGRPVGSVDGWEKGDGPPAILHVAFRRAETTWLLLGLLLGGLACIPQRVSSQKTECSARGPWPPGPHMGTQAYPFRFVGCLISSLVLGWQSA